MVRQLYIAFFNRPADTEGLAAFSNALANSQNAELGSMLGAFTSLGESQGQPSGDQQSDLINNIYVAIFGRSADSQGLSFWADALNPSQESRRQLDDALQDAANKAESGPVNEYDPWGSYIHVARREYTTDLPGERYNNMSAHYEGKVKGTVGDESVNGILNMQFNLSPVSNDITGSMNFGSHGTLRMNVSSDFGDNASFSVALARLDDKPVFGGNIVEGGFNGNLFGPDAKQVGGNWNVTVDKGGLSPIEGGGVFAGAKVTP